MDASMDDILQRMGWTTGLELPLANDENKDLQKEVEKLMLQKARATQCYESEESRYNNIGNHLKYVKQQNSETQNLLTTYRQHLNTQEHKLLLTQAENERVQQEMRHMEKDMENIESRIVSKKSDLERGLSKTDKMKLENRWDSEALKAWDESLKKRDEDNELLKKFSKEDEKKAKDLEAKRQNLQIEVVTRKETLNKTIGDVGNYYQVLDRTGKVFKQQKRERKYLIKQWQETVRNLRHRDETLHATVKEITMVQDLITEEQEKLNEQNNFLKNEQMNNKEVEQQIQELNVVNSKLRRELNELIEFVLTLNSEAIVLKQTLISTAQFLVKERAKGRNLIKDIEFKASRINYIEGELVRLEKKLNDVKNSSMSAADRAKQLEEIIDNEQRQSRILDTDVEKMQSLLFRTQQSVNFLKEAAKLKEMEIAGCETSTNLMQRHIHSVTNNLQKQKEINYNLDFRISQIESKLAKLEGHSVDDEDKHAMEEKIMELEKSLAVEIEVKQMLNLQANQIEQEMRRLTSAIHSDNSQLNTMKDKLQNEVLSFESGMKQIATDKNLSQQRQVVENILQLRVNQLENVLKREDFSIYNLQKFRLELEMAVRERQIEINTNKDILIAKRRNLDEEKRRLKRDIGCRLIKLDQLQKRFHIAMMALGKDEDGQPLTVTHFKIRNVQEKYMLQHEGDELDAKVKRSEKEIVAMENTLRVVNSSNVSYRQSLSAVSEFDKEAEDMRALEAEISSISTTVRHKKKDLAIKKHQVKDLKQTLHKTDEIKIEAKKELATIEDEQADLRRYTEEQSIKIDRADRHLNVCMNNLNIRTCEKYRLNLIIRQLQDANKSALQQLAEVSTRYQETTPHISRYTSAHALQLPGPRLQFTPSTSSNDSSRSSEYYASGPYVSSLLLNFDPTPPVGNKIMQTKKIKRKVKYKKS